MVPCNWLLTQSLMQARASTPERFWLQYRVILRCRRVRAPNAPASSSQPILRLANCFSNLIQENRSSRAIHHPVVAREG